MTQFLNQETLSSLPEGLTWAGYDRSSLSAGIVHIGVGNFHRAHMAHYLDRLFEIGEGKDWALVGAGVKAADASMRERLEKQDWLTTVMELDPQTANARIVGSMIDFLPVGPEPILAALANPAIRIVSMTLTEGGYYLDPASGEFDDTHPEVLADAQNPEDPQTVFGILVEALRQRRDNSLPSFSVMSCDNLPGNGNVVKSVILGLANLFDKELVSWISRNTAFPNGMVDCITPATTDRERAIIKDTFDFEDRAPVLCEPFRQWVIEDHFSSGRPPLEKVGVEFVSDVSGHELMKLRILNAGHASMAYVASLLGHHFVHEAMADADIRAWLSTLCTQEIIPTLKPIEGVNYQKYLDTVLDRFANPKIGDTIPRLAAEGSDRQPKFILPTLHDALIQKTSIEGLSLEIALWAHYCEVQLSDENSSRLADSQRERLRKFVVASERAPSLFLEMEQVFGDLCQNDQLSHAFSKWLTILRDIGARATLRRYIQN